MAWRSRRASAARFAPGQRWPAPPSRLGSALRASCRRCRRPACFYSKDKYDTERYERLRVLATEMMAMGAGVATEEIIDLFRQDTGYATPRVDVRGAAFRDGRVLMVRERNDGRWALPGGWADVNQTAGQCVAREIEEESGFSARAVKLCAVWDRRRHGHDAATPVLCPQDVFPVRDHRRQTAPEPRNQRNRLLRRRRTARPIAWPCPAGSDPAHVRALALSGIADRFRLGSIEFNSSPISFSASREARSPSILSRLALGSRYCSKPLSKIRTSARRHRFPHAAFPKSATAPLPPPTRPAQRPALVS